MPGQGLRVPGTACIYGDGLGPALWTTDGLKYSALQLFKKGIPGRRASFDMSASILSPSGYPRLAMAPTYRNDLKQAADPFY